MERLTTLILYHLAMYKHCHIIMLSVANIIHCILNDTHYIIRVISQRRSLIVHVQLMQRRCMTGASN